MDLANAARRFAKPFVFRDPGDFARLPLDARGLIGDGFSAALVAADGAIDWMCMPRFDSPSVLARVLDAERGGSMAVRPASFPFTSLQQYETDTNVLETLMQTERGALRVLDCMPWSNDPRSAVQQVHRRIDCIRGEMEVELLFDPRFDYGRDVPTVEFAEHGLLALGAKTERLSLSINGNVTWQRLARGGVRGVVKMSAGQRLWCVLDWNASQVEAVLTHRPYEHLRVTRRNWRHWAASIAYDGPWRDDVVRSALVLKLLMYAPSGAVVAAPTTSLPEWPGGTRNWDYRYCWARDSAMAIRAANLLGYRDEARDFYHFLRDAIQDDDGLQLMYTIDGARVPDEEVLPHLTGALGSAPVRIGNGARDQIQLDTTGAIVDAAHLFERFGGNLTLRAWRKLAKIIERAETSWSTPDHGIWEPRIAPQHNVHSKLMNWLAMDRGAQLANVFGRTDLEQRWAKLAQDIHADICKNAMDATGRHFVGIYGQEHADATLLLLPIHGFLPDGDPRALATTAWVRERLTVGPFVYRYLSGDGVGGDEGAFSLCGFWLAEAMALQGDLDSARHVFDAHTDASNHLGLLAEELDPNTRQQLGNFPQAFSHLGLINAALRIDLAMRLRDEGSARSPHLVGPLPRKS